ncbi:hypothetical protein EIP91_010052 [Steccherinum ochraceum]|uniref:AB hydrolase-1 domain-containing protein n=1 Tax=Steccherinum ochraceum TaxID=92696 RepID=A0A4R0RA75_9APHY|nr:hypothetical protein EIP91_010052 [Steccherinum ochraceum]
MTALPLSRYGKFAVHDTGVPTGDGEYITLLLLHGFVWHSGIFSRMVPFASKYNVRLLLVNRRDYPGALAFTETELKPLKAGAAQTSYGAESMREYLKGRGRDLHEFLELFIEQERIPKPNGARGGIILAGWSMGAMFTTALLAYGSSFPVGKINVATYLRCVLNHDSSNETLGYPTFEPGYNPIIDLSSKQSTDAFCEWLSAYYAHGKTPATLEFRTPLPEPKATTLVMSVDEIQSTTYTPPGQLGGSDLLLLIYGKRHGTIQEARRRAYLLGADGEGAHGWDEVKLKHVWCEQSAWRGVMAKFCLEEEAETARKEGKKFRTHEIVGMKRANHFIHWDEPERTLLTLLGKTDT